MKKDNKKALYESIMTSVAKEVKKVLNEDYDLFDKEIRWWDTHKDVYNKIKEFIDEYNASDHDWNLQLQFNRSGGVADVGGPGLYLYFNPNDFHKQLNCINIETKNIFWQYFDENHQEKWQKEKNNTSQFTTDEKLNNNLLKISEYINRQKQND